MLGVPAAPFDAVATAAPPPPELESGFHLYRDVVLGALDLGFGATATARVGAASET